MADINQFGDDILKNKFNKIIIEKLPQLKLNDTWLVAGCLFQTVWNLKSGKPPEEDISDYDIFYFDDNTSYEAEDREIKRVAGIFSDLPVKVELRNQARVPLWYKEKYGYDYPPVTSSKDTISRFMFCCNCVGLTLKEEEIEIYAPFGIEDIYNGILRTNITSESYTNPLSKIKKAEKYIKRWPWLKLLEY